MSLLRQSALASMSEAGSSARIWDLSEVGLEEVMGVLGEEGWLEVRPSWDLRSEISESLVIPWTPKKMLAPSPAQEMMARMTTSGRRLRGGLGGFGAAAIMLGLGALELRVFKSVGLIGEVPSGIWFPFWFLYLIGFLGIIITWKYAIMRLKKA